MMYLSRPMWCLCVLGMCVWMAGCSSPDVTWQERCDEARRCVSGAPEVCGEDGKTYACGELARCEGVIVDASGMACLIDPPVCQPLACEIVCAGGFEKDAQGCDTCACRPIDCAPIAPPVCSDSDERIVCDEGDVCGASCRCEPLPCSRQDFAECPPNSQRVCVERDGCEMCDCVLVCPPMSDFMCDEGEELSCEDMNGDGCEACRCERAPVCPEPSVTCELACEYGFEKDAQGCERCACGAPVQCLDDQTCGMAETCVEQVSDQCCARGTTCTDDLPACENFCQSM